MYPLCTNNMIIGTDSMKFFSHGQWCKTTQWNSKSGHPKFSKKAVFCKQPGDVVALAHEEEKRIHDRGAAGFTELELFC